MEEPTYTPNPSLPDPLYPESGTPDAIPPVFDPTTGQPQKDNKKMIIIIAVAVVVLLLCCCVLVIGGGLASGFFTDIFNQLSQALPQLPLLA